MKHLINLLLLLLILVNLKAQDHIPVLDSDTIHWTYFSDIYCGDCIHTVKIWAYGDTTINDQQYRMLYLQRGSDGVIELAGFLQEDTVNSKMTMLSYSGQCQDVPCIENVIYDMNIGIEDTLEFYTGGSVQYLLVTNIDTIEKRKNIHFGDDLTFIEGVGATRELTLDSFHGLSEILCKFHNDQLYFHRQVWEFDTCYIPLTTVGIETKAIDEVVVYPNPTHLNQSIEIRSPFKQKTKLNIYSITGELLYSSEFQHSYKVSPNFFTNNKGVYIIHLNDTEYNARKTILVLH